MILSGTRFGELKYNKKKILCFNEGLLGFPQCQHFLLISHSKGSIFKWLQSIEEPTLAWPVVNPLLYVPDYQLSLASNEQAEFEVFGIVNISSNNLQEGTINLLAPIIIDFKTSIGKQIIIETANYQVKYPLFNHLKNGIHNVA